MDPSIEERIKTAQFICLAFLAFFVILCFLELVVNRVMHTAIVMSTGVLFFSSAAVFGIDDRNMDWRIGRWSQPMKVFMLLFLFFVTVITADMLNITQIGKHGRVNLINKTWREHRVM
jgi:hypothetical protein